MELDIHTHNLAAPAGTAIINVPREWLLCPEAARFRAGCLYSVGIHPWWTADVEQLAAMKAGARQLLEREDVVAVGECGIDRLRGGNLKLQEEVFRWHIALAASVSRPRPLLIHCVRAYDLLLRLRKLTLVVVHEEVARQSLLPTAHGNADDVSQLGGSWIIHGFRGRPTLAQQLLAAGFSLSFGRRYNVESFRLTPPDRRFRETDDDFSQS